MVRHLKTAPVAAPDRVWLLPMSVSVSRRSNARDEHVSTHEEDADAAVDDCSDSNSSSDSESDRDEDKRRRRRGSGEEEEEEAEEEVAVVVAGFYGPDVLLWNVTQQTEVRASSERRRAIAFCDFFGSFGGGVECVVCVCVSNLFAAVSRGVRRCSSRLGFVLLDRVH